MDSDVRKAYLQKRDSHGETVGRTQDGLTLGFSYAFWRLVYGMLLCLMSWWSELRFGQWIHLTKVSGSMSYLFHLRQESEGLINASSFQVSKVGSCECPFIGQNAHQTSEQCPWIVYLAYRSLPLPCVILTVLIEYYVYHTWLWKAHFFPSVTELDNIK